MQDPQSRGEKREQKVVNAVRKLIKNCDEQTTVIRRRWRENYELFVYGSPTDDKQEWQTKFSVPKLQTAIRTAQGHLLKSIVNTPDWFDIEAKADGDATAERLAPTFKKLMDYYIESARLKRHLGTFILCSLISMGTIVVGWRKRLIKNPEWVLQATEKERQKAAARLAKNVANPDTEEPPAADELEQQMLNAVDEFAAQATGSQAERKVPKYVQVGTLDLIDPNHESIYWDPTVQYMEDSPWRAFECDIPRYKLVQAAKQGFFPMSKVKKVGGKNDTDSKETILNLRYKNTQRTTTNKLDTVKLTVYYGPLVTEGDAGEPIIEKDDYFCVIANDSVILKDGDYPFWEPPGHSTAVISAAVRQIPYRATGAGIGDNAAQLQKIYDSNWQLLCDTFRFGIAGINIVDYQALVDKGQLAEGIYPGMTLEVRGKPNEVFRHENLTSNLESQASPVQAMLEGAIENATGVNGMMEGEPNPKGRTPAAETAARIQAGSDYINTIALDLEQNFLLPLLEKIFARILQFGIAEVVSNPELQALLNDDEVAALQQLSAQQKLEILNQWYSFKIRAFSNAQDKNLRAQRDTELLQVANAPGSIVGMLVNWPYFMRQYAKNRDLDPDEFIINNSPLEQITSESQLLLSGHGVEVSPQDDHKLHLQFQGPLAQGPMATPQAQQHAQMHMMFMQQMEMQQQAQAGGPPQGAPPGSPPPGQQTH